MHTAMISFQNPAADLTDFSKGRLFDKIDKVLAHAPMLLAPSFATTSIFRLRAQLTGGVIA